MNFVGTFDGDNHTISNLKITNTSTYSGLFGKTSGTLKNFTLKGNITLSADGDMIGGVVGYADGSTISNVTSYVNISNTEGTLKHIGGVVGGIDNKNTVVDKCVYYGTLNISNSHDCIGGIVGYTNAGARISNCANHGTVTTSEAGAYTGGILGYVNNSNPTIKDCYNFGTVSNGDSTQSYIEQDESNISTEEAVSVCVVISSLLLIISVLVIYFCTKNGKRNSIHSSE